MIKLFNTSKGNFCAVRVPDFTKAHKVELHREYWQVDYEYNSNQPYTHGGFSLFFKDFGGRKKYPTELEVIGIAEYLVENQATQVVDSIQSHKTLYVGDRMHYTLAADALQSLIESKGCDVGKWLIIKHKKS